MTRHSTKDDKTAIPLADSRYQRPGRGDTPIAEEWHVETDVQDHGRSVWGKAKRNVAKTGPSSKVLGAPTWS